MFPMTRPCRVAHRRSAFTLIELLTVIGIISLLISILMPSMSRAREQAKSVHCLARLHEFGVGLTAYSNTIGGLLPPALWKPDNLEQQPGRGRGLEPDVEYGWAELLWAYAYSEEVRTPESYPTQRNIDGERWEEYMICRSVGSEEVNSGHYRVYLPAWSMGTYTILPDGRYGHETRADPRRGAAIERIRPRLPIIADANVQSERGDGFGADDCSYIDAGEANTVGSNGYDGNRLSDRHYGGANYLFSDVHAVRNTKLREQLARDWDLNGIEDIAVIVP